MEDDSDMFRHRERNNKTAADLHVAIYSQNAETVIKCAIDKKIINCFWRGCTAVSSALYLKRYDILKILVKNGADCNLCTRNNKMEPPLFAACRLRDERAIDILLNSKGININKPEFFGRSPLFAAARNCSACVVELLLNKGAILNKPNIPPKYHPINGALQHSGKRAKGVIDLLVHRGSYLDSVCEESPLKWAVKNADCEIFCLLVSAGCKVKSEAWLSYDNLPAEWKQDEPFCNWIESLKKSPASLRNMTACVIRKILTSKWDTLHEYHVNKLALPSSLNSLILLTDFFTERCE